jgi:hypothetical protein
VACLENPRQMLQHHLAEEQRVMELREKAAFELDSAWITCYHFPLFPAAQIYSLHLSQRSGNDVGSQ